MNEYIYVIRPAQPNLVSAPTAEQTEIVGQHFNYLSGLKDSGQLLLAGRTQVDESFGIIVFEAENDEQARTIMESDPAVAQGVFSAELFPYRVALMAGRD